MKMDELLNLKTGTRLRLIDGTEIELVMMSGKFAPDHPPVGDSHAGYMPYVREIGKPAGFHCFCYEVESVIGGET